MLSSSPDTGRETWRRTLSSDDTIFFTASFCSIALGLIAKKQFFSPHCGNGILKNLDMTTAETGWRHAARSHPVRMR